MEGGTAKSTPIEMSQTRRVLVNIMLLGLLAASAFEIATGGEHWPFSSYPMYSGVRQEARVDHLVFIAVPQDGSASFPLYKHEQIYPYLWSRQRKAFQRLLERPDGEEAVQAGLENLLQRYEANRQRERHGAPPLKAVQLYRVEWTLDPNAPNMIEREERTFVTTVEFNADKMTQ